ncbi:MAG: response regulator [Planctomycetota bacterium]
MSLVYVIEDDTPLREILAEALTHGIGVGVLGCASVTEAAMSFGAYPPAMILCDLNLPDRSGLEILDELDRACLEVPVVFVSGYLPTYRAYIPERANISLLAKPFDLNTLLQFVLDELNRQHAAEDPENHEMGFYDYVRLACVGGHTVEINLFDSETGAELVGRVLVLGGQLWSAQDGDGAGSEAFERLANMKTGQVTCNALLNTAVQRNIHEPWDGLLLRAMSHQPVHQAGTSTAAPELAPEGAMDAWYGESIEGMGYPGVPYDELAQAEGNPAPIPVYSQPEPAPEPPPAPAVPTLSDLIQAANYAEDQGNPRLALNYLEQAMAQYPGHPEILLAALRLQKKTS